MGCRIRRVLWIPLRLTSLPRSEQAALSSEHLLVKAQDFFITERLADHGDGTISRRVQFIVPTQRVVEDPSDASVVRGSTIRSPLQTFHRSTDIPSIPEIGSRPAAPHGKAINLRAPRLISRTDHHPYSPDCRHELRSHDRDNHAVSRSSPERSLELPEMRLDRLYCAGRGIFISEVG